MISGTGQVHHRRTASIGGPQRSREACSPRFRATVHAKDARHGRPKHRVIFFISPSIGGHTDSGKSNASARIAVGRSGLRAQEFVQRRRTAGYRPFCPCMMRNSWMNPRVHRQKALHTARTASLCRQKTVFRASRVRAGWGQRNIMLCPAKGRSPLRIEVLPFAGLRRRRVCRHWHGYRCPLRPCQGH